MADGVRGVSRQLTTLRFTMNDWASVRFAEAPGPLVETVLGLAELRRQPNGIGASRWASRARLAFPAAARPLLELVPASGPWPTFLDPAISDLDDALVVVAATPRLVLRRQLAATWRRAQAPPAWLKALADGDPEAMRTLVHALRAFNVACVAPHWPQILASFRGDVTERMAVLAGRGLGEVFGTLHRDLAWRDGALVRSSTVGLPGEFWLDGRGLQILPSVLWTGPPLFAVPQLTLGASAVIYAARTPAGLQGVREPRALAALIGRTRAAVLEALREPCSTAELAARVGIGAPSASEHAAVLRDADLIQTIRCGRGVRHSLTPLGRNLLNGTEAARRANSPAGAQESTRVCGERGGAVP
jgi:DNA-binding transcriptional ArsR family regulator